MREQEMRQRVFQFLKARMRNMLMPATLGIGLAVGGCSQSNALKDSPDSAHDTSATDTAKESLPIPLYMVLSPDSNFPVPDGLGPNPEKTDAIADLANGSLPEATPVYGSDVSPLDLRKADAADVSVPDVAPAPDEAVALDGAGIDGSMPTDAGPDLGGIITKYIAPIPDAGPDGGVAPGPDAAKDTGGITPLYIAPVYIAQMPDADPADTRPAVRYLAQMPDSSVVTPLYMAAQPS